MTRMDRKALAIAIALLLAFASQSASAFTITNLSGLDTLSYQLESSDLNLSGWSYEDTGSSRYTSFLFGLWSFKRSYSYGGTTVPVPEPSAALVFGLGLFAASRFARRKR